MALFASAPVRIQPYFGYRSRNRLVLEARALRSAKREFEPGGRIRAMRIMLAQFASREAEGVRVRLEMEAPDGHVVSHEAVTDKEGFVRFDLALDPDWELPDHPCWERADLLWQNAKGPQRAVGHVLAPGLNGTLAVISDIDDTIIETGITGGLRSLLRNWRRVLAQLPGERRAVPGADVFYDALGGGEVPADGARPAKRIPATHRPFFYISSSPWNLFSYLVTFQRMKGLPLGPLLLRDWGLNRETFGSGSHGRHKRAAIDTVLAMYPELSFALIGDDTQGDLPAFAEVVADHPGRIAAVFLRTVAEEDLSPAEKRGAETIEAAGVPLWLGDSFAVGEEFLHTLGFTPGGETEQIVRAVENAEAEPDAAARTG